MGKGGKGGKAAGNDRPKNWRCDQCGNTDNCAWWSECSGKKGTCKAPKPEPKPQGDAEDKWSSWDHWGASGWTNYQAPPLPPDELLRAARENLKVVTGIFPPGHAAIDEVAKRVAGLEEAQKVTVPPSEQLRCLLQAQKEWEAKQAESKERVSKAAETVRSATAALKAEMEWREEVDRELATNHLDVAALSRDVGARNVVTPGDVVQTLRARVDILADTDFVDGGFVKAELGVFFQGLAKLVAVIDHAEHRAASVQAAPVASIAAAPAPATPAPGPDLDAAANMVDAASTNEGLGFSEEEPEEDEDDPTMTDGDSAAAKALKEADTLLASSTVWSATLPTTVPSNG